MTKNQPRINYYGTLSAGQGYSSSIENTIVALDRLGIDVRVKQLSRVPDVNISEDGKRIMQKPFLPSPVSVVHGFPISFPMADSDFRVGFTMFETDKLPEGVNDWSGAIGDGVKIINQCLDLLLVPCKHNQELFKRSGVKVPIEIVPNGVDTKQFPYMERPERETFTFYMYGTLTLRKNPGMVISAFASLFRDKPNVRLVLKTQSGTLGHVEYKDMGNITVIDELWTIEDMQKALFEADAFVFPSRGEGFGLPPLEAMATGLPTIIADNTGMSDYANPEYNYVVPTKELKPALRYPKKWGDVGNWYEPDYEVLKQKMSEIYSNPSRAKKVGQRASQWVVSEWNYDKSAEKMVAAIKKHYKGWG